MVKNYSVMSTKEDFISGNILFWFLLSVCTLQKVTKHTNKKLITKN
jgi:hypothetical protein